MGPVYDQSAQPLCFHEGFHKGSYLYKMSKGLKGLVILEGDKIPAEQVRAHILGYNVGDSSGHCDTIFVVLDQDVCSKSGY